jgi:LysM repeat protein
MNRLRSVVVLIVVPAVVALLVTLLVLNIWERQQGGRERVIMLPTYSSTAMIPPRETLPPPPQTAETAGEEAASIEQPVNSPSCENPTHVVASGETLGAIAGQYGLPLDDLIAVNLMVDPAFDANFLSVGQQIIIPVCGVPTPTPSPSPIPTLVPTRIIPSPIPTASQPPPGAVKVQIARVIAAGEVTREGVEIVNRGSPVEMRGWMLSDGRGHEFTFPSFRLFTGGGVVVYTGVGTNSSTSLYWGLTAALWSPGNTVYLYDSEGTLQDEFNIP